jgi:sugar phosphate isomerase/epimerase
MSEISDAKTRAWHTSVITDEIDQDFETACDLAVEFNLEAVEIRSVYEHGPFEFSCDDIERMRKILAKKGLKACAISSPFFKCKIDDPGEIREHLEGLRRCMVHAEKLGAALIRGFTFWAGPEDFDPEAIASRFEEAVKILDERDFTLVLESDPSVRAANAATLTQVIKAINSPRVRGLWDPGNDMWDPCGEVPYPDGYNYIKKYITHVHLKDATKKTGKPE